MKKSLITLAILLVLAGCGKEIDISQKQVRNGVVYTVNESEPFTGKVTGKYNNGQVKIAEKFKAGKYDGEQLYYYDNGQIKEKISFKDGKAIGTYTEYHKNGEISYTGRFVDGKKDGEWNRYTEDKKLILTEKYKAGKLEDVEQFIVDTDKLKNKINSFFN